MECAAAFLESLTMHHASLLASTDLPNIAKGTHDIATESIVLAALFLFGVITFIVLRWAALPLARTVLDIMKEISSITISLKGMVERVEKAAEKLEDQHGSGAFQRPGMPTALNG
jgi:hypothetical protein